METQSAEKHMIEFDLQVQHYFSGREYAKRMHLPAGHEALTHEHEYDHLSILAAGEVVVTIAGNARRYTGPDCITIKAGQPHHIEAITDSVWFCVHATSGTDPDHVDDVLIKKV